MTLLSRIVADFETSLAGAVSAGDTSFVLQTATDDDSVTLSDGTYCFTLDRDNSSAKEYVVGQLTASTKTVSSVQSVSRQGALTSGFARSHRIGTNVIISDHSVLNALVTILNGTGTLDSGSPISYDGTATISGANMLATKAYVDSVVNGGTVSYDNQILSAQTAGETVATGNLVYLKTSDSRWYLVDTDTATTYDGVTFGIALGAGTSGNTISGGVQISGRCSAFTGLTANTEYYASGTAGAISTSAGTVKIAVGLAVSTTAIILGFNKYATPLGNQKDALAGGGSFGTPSTSNKYLTQDYWNTNFVMDTGLIGATRTSTTVSNSTVETTVFTKTIPAGTLGTTDGIKVEFSADFNVDSNTDNPEFSVYYGSTKVATFTVPNGSTGTGGISEATVYGTLYIINNSSLSSQLVFGQGVGLKAGYNGAQTSAPTRSNASLQATVSTTAAYDTSSQFDLTLRIKNENASATESITFNWALVTKLGGLL